MIVRVLVVDNHDSFVHTLVGYLRELGASIELIESDAIDEDGLVARIEEHDAVLLSPGPGTPADAGISRVAVHIAATRRTPLLGVCLGHQTIGAAFGMSVGEAPELMHGMVSEITHDGTGLFAGLPSPLAVGRYHSLALAEQELPEGFRVTARTSTGTVMAIEHRDLPILGVQFHPESVLTEGGYRLLANWLELCGDPSAVERSAPLHPRAPRAL